jgi:hypothetical protein
MKLIIVGNGQPLKPLGVQINQFDTVIRLSNYRIRGYEHIVGDKTDIASVARVVKLDPVPPIIWIGNPMGISAIPEPALKSVYPEGWVKNPFLKNAYEVCGYLEMESHPTLGMLTIIWAINAALPFYEVPVYISGFNFSQVGHPRYYWDNTPYPGCEKYIHDLDNERKVLKQLISDGYVKYLDPEEIIYLESKPHPNISKGKLWAVN